jgi:hypothetical protein
MSGPALSIASAYGVPGTAGALVSDAAGALFLLSNHHVVFGGGAKPGDRVWALPPQDGHDRQVAFIGWGRRGQIGRVTWQSETFFVDCALIELADVATYPDWLQLELTRSSGFTSSWPNEIAHAQPGIGVIKTGASTGLTEGILVDVAYPDFPYIGDRAWTATGQLLVDSADAELNFSGPGDSGAMLLDCQGRMLGLLWGSNTGGQGIACPIGPVLHCLAVEPAARLPWSPVCQ